MRSRIESPITFARVNEILLRKDVEDRESRRERDRIADVRPSDRTGVRVHP